MEANKYKTDGPAESEPDVWWGHDGIDALVWADPIPYVLPDEDDAEETTP